MPSYDNKQVLLMINPKGRVLTDFLLNFGPSILEQDRGLPELIVNILEADKVRVKGLEEKLKSDPDASRPKPEEILNDILPGYTGKRPEVSALFTVENDYTRQFQPERIVLRYLECSVVGQPFKLIGNSNPFESLRRNMVSLAVFNSDLAADRLLPETIRYFGFIKPWWMDIEDPQSILDNLPVGTTTIRYEGRLDINFCSHVLFANRAPSELTNLAFDAKGIPLLDQGVPVYIDGQYFFAYDAAFGSKFVGRRAFNKRMNFIESENVEYAVFDGDSSLRFGLYIVSSGDTLLKAAKGRDFSVVVTPIFRSMGGLFSNPEAPSYSRRVKDATNGLFEINHDVKKINGGECSLMKTKLEGHFIGNAI